MRGTCSNPASFNPVKLFRPSVYTVEPGATFCLRKASRVEALKSGMTDIRARPVARPRFSTATRLERVLLSDPSVVGSRASRVLTTNPRIINLHFALQWLAGQVEH